MARSRVLETLKPPYSASIYPNSVLFLFSHQHLSLSLSLAGCAPSFSSSPIRPVGCLPVFPDSLRNVIALPHAHVTRIRQFTSDLSVQESRGVPLGGPSDNLLLFLSRSE